MLFANWDNENPNLHNLQFYFILDVVNPQTVQIIARVLKETGFNQVPYWPGLRMDIKGEHGEAILGSPLGSTLAFMLVMHKAELGIKRVRAVTIFRDNRNSQSNVKVNLLFEIENVPANEIDVGVGMIGLARADLVELKEEGVGTKNQGPRQESVLRTHDFRPINEVASY